MRIAPATTLKFLPDPDSLSTSVPRPRTLVALYNFLVCVEAEDFTHNRLLINLLLLIITI